MAHICANLLAVVAAELTVTAEQIQFSKPAIEIAAPAKGEEFLPATTAKSLEFGTPQLAPPMQMPMPMQQPMLIRRSPRSGDPQDDRNPFGNPFGNPDGPAKTSPRSPGAPDSPDMFVPEAFARPRKGGDLFSLNQTESQRALAPVLDLYWDGRESAKNPKTPLFGNAAAERDDASNDRRKPAFLMSREEEGTRDNGFQVARFSDFLGRDSKEKPSQELLDRRASFEQLLNPGAGIAGRTPGSLEPLPSLNSAPVLPTMPPPTIGRAKTEATFGDPMEGFNRQRERLRGPSLEDVNKRYARPASATPSSSVEPRFQTPLNRQPTAREFPTRKF